MKRKQIGTECPLSSKVLIKWKSKHVLETLFPGSKITRIVLWMKGGSLVRHLQSIRNVQNMVS